MQPIYLDHHATTPLDPRVLEAMLPYFKERFGNSASKTHRYGWEAHEAVERSRARVARCIGARPEEILFTSGATESNNLALKGIADFYGKKGNHFVTGATEHKCVLAALKALERQGFEVTVLEVDGQGQIDLGDLRRSIRETTLAVSIMLANNEIGTLQPMAEIGAICRQAGILLHCDAAQGVGKLPIRVDDLAIDLLSMSAHKLYGPKGVGALYVRRRGRRVRLTPLLDGGGQERGMRSGTLNVPGIVGFGEACKLSIDLLPTEAPRIRDLRDRLQAGLMENLGELVRINGHPTERLDGNLHVSFRGIAGESLVTGLPGLAVSSGAACGSATLEPSYVLRAMGVPPELAHSSLRFGIGRFNTAEEIDTAVEMVTRRVRQLREESPLG